MQKKPINIISFNPSFFPLSNNNHRSKKINNKFKKSSTAQYSSKTKPNQPKLQTPSDTPIGINSINNNIYLNLFNKFNTNTSSLKYNMMSPKEIIGNRINNNQMNKIRKNLNMNEVPSSSSIKTKNKSTYIKSDLINSMNFINNKGHINIRLNLKNPINDNNNNNNININNSNTNISECHINYEYIAEKMKEKDLKIIQLQNDLLKSQEIINNLNNINNNINNSFKFNNNLNKSSREKNFFILTKSSESVDKILKTSFNEYYLNNIGNKKLNKKNHKNSFLKKSEKSGNNNKKRLNTNNNINDINSNKKNINNNIKINNLLYTENNIKNKKQSNYDYLRLLLPLSNFNNFNNTKPRFNSYSNDRKNQKNKINYDNYLNNTNKNKKQKLCTNSNINNKNNINKENNFSEFVNKCSNIKQRAKNLIINYIDLANYLTLSKIES